MSQNPVTDTANTARRVKENVHNMPLTSVALAGVVGAGVAALLSLGMAARRKM